MNGRFTTVLVLALALAVLSCATCDSGVAHNIPFLKGTDSKRAWLLPSQVGAIPDVIAYGYVVLPPNLRPGTAKHDRALRLCESWWDGIAEVEPEAPDWTRPKPLFVTYWPLTEPAGDCAEAVEFYDHLYGDALMACLGLQKDNGPFLVARRRPLRAREWDQKTLLLDLTSVDSRERHAFDVPIRRWVGFTDDEPFQGILRQTSDGWAAITSYVSNGTFEVGDVEWFDQCR